MQNLPLIAFVRLRAHAFPMREKANHPCLRCGACCAVFRVSFYWREAEPSEKPTCVPVELTEDFSPFRRVMKGTNLKHHSRCIALKGKVGSGAECSIYSSRPSTCREFAASFEQGEHQPRCDQARAHHNLPPLRRADWQDFEQLSASSPSCYTPEHEEPSSITSPLSS